jgi:hypothetical protein
MWVFTRPRGGMNYDLLTQENRWWMEFCPIHRFDGMDQVPGYVLETFQVGWYLNSSKHCGRFKTQNCPKNNFKIGNKGPRSAIFKREL